jgi:hypothetical protein
MGDATPIRAPVAGLISYRTILSHVPARSYINPTLSMIPKLQEYQYSFDWHSDLGSLDDLGKYSALLDANSEVLSQETVRRLVEYVEGGGRLVLLERSGRYSYDADFPEYLLLEELGCPDRQGNVAWEHGEGKVKRIGENIELGTTDGCELLLKTMEWCGINRPIRSNPGVLAALSRKVNGNIYAIIFWPGEEKSSTFFTLDRGILSENKTYSVTNLLDPDGVTDHHQTHELESRIALSLEPFELKVLAISPG